MIRNFLQKIVFWITLFVLPEMIMHEKTNAADFNYPKPQKSEQKDDYFGTTVADPYRWMETNGSPELENWIDAENQWTRAYLEKIPFRDALRERMTQTINYPKYSTPFVRNGRMFYFKNDGLQNQSVLYIVDTPDAKPRVLIDPNQLSDDGAVSLQRTAVSRDGKYLAYSIARSGSDWNEIFVLDIESGKTLTDHLQWVKFSGIAWERDGFYYSRYDEPPKDKILTAKNEYQKIFYHKIGTEQNADSLIRENKEHPLRTIGAFTDKDERFLFISEGESTYGNSLVFKDLLKRNAGFQTIVLTFDSEQDIVTALDGKFYMLTDRKAPNKRLVLVDPRNPQEEHWTDVIPETDSLLDAVTCIGGKFVVTYLKDAADVAYVYDRNGKRLREIELPTLGVTGFSGEKDQTEYFQAFTSFTYPTVIYRCDMESGEQKELFPSALNIDQNEFVTERVWYSNSDGRKVPIFLTYKKGLKKDGANPTLLYGYGGFNISMSPSFSALRLPFLQSGGIFAVAVLRGGGEYGETWHKAGTKLQKKNVFNDFIAAAEFLISEKYTSPQKLAVQGGSNGGLLVGATVTQRPDLFRAGIAAVGVMDMLRYHKFTIGWAWATDYGTSEDGEEMFQYLLSYSPLHNIKSGVNYPALLITTSDHDDRVVPAHSFKFTASMQEKSTGERPALIRIETKAGHGAGKPISKVIDESADVWAFLMNELGMTLQ
ncbi:MAG: prolyl oligopeptidase family serine peptidase [Planctomycetaceae bacterium]|jgi:prolyl oligopeptidase|nr:prolyl oligopeptidase family serine peptidase [Planctomycetaceae bacterium]